MDILLTQLFNSFYKIPLLLNDILVYSFQKLGSLIARKPWYFIIVPTILTILATVGIRQEIHDMDFENLSSPKKGRWADEKRLVDKHFPYNTKSNFDPLRVTQLGHYVNLIVSSKDGGNILRDKIWTSIVRLDETITTTITNGSSSPFSYEDLCAQWKGRCFHPMLPIKPSELTIMAKLADLIHLHNFKNVSILRFLSHLEFSLSLILGNPEFNNKGILNSAEAITLYYWLRSDNSDEIARAKKWEKMVTNYVERARFKRISVFVFTGRTHDDEMQMANDQMKQYLALSGILVVIFAAASSAMQDWVRSKIVLSTLGILSVVMATWTAFGILMYSQIPFIEMNFVALFLMLGIGIDDMFVFLAAWRNTSLESTVEERLATTYGQASVAVTITSLTNATAFFIGTYTNIRTIEIFSLYACTSALISYLFFLTFFGGWLAVFGHAEKSQRHSVFCCLEVLPTSLSGSKSWLYRKFLTGGINALDPKNPNDNEKHLAMVLLQRGLGLVIHNKIAKGAIFTLYVCYVTGSIFGILSLELETHPYRVSFRNATKDYFTIYDKYFSRKPSFVQIVLTKELDYSDEGTREGLLNLQSSLEELPFVRRDLTISWMSDSFRFLRQKPSLADLVRDEASFLHHLQMVMGWDTEKAENCEISLNQIANFNSKNLTLLDEIMIKRLLDFLQHFPCHGGDMLRNILPKHLLKKRRDFIRYVRLLFWISDQIQRGNSLFEMDTHLDDAPKRIMASRFLIAVDNCSSYEVQQTIRKVIQDSGVPGASTFIHEAIVTDQINLVKETTVSAITSTTLTVLVISLILIPNLLCSVWVALSIISIETGVVGFMAMWKVNLNAVSMINLIICVGFSVDYSVHISYSYLSSTEVEAKDRIDHALYSVALPILLGGISTIIGIFPICFTDSIIFMTFFKIIFLVIVIGVIHAFFFLPVFISTLDSICKCDSDAATNEVSVVDLKKSLKESPMYTIDKKIKSP